MTETPWQVPETEMPTLSNHTFRGNKKVDHRETGHHLAEPRVFGADTESRSPRASLSFSLAAGLWVHAAETPSQLRLRGSPCHWERAVHFSEVDATSHPPADAQGSRGVGLGGDRGVGAAEPLGHRASPDNWSLCRLRQITQHPLPAIVSASVRCRHPASPPASPTARWSGARKAPYVMLAAGEQSRPELGSGMGPAGGWGELRTRSRGHRPGSDMWPLLRKQELIGSCHLPARPFAGCWGHSKEADRRGPLAWEPHPGRGW